MHVCVFVFLPRTRGNQKRLSHLLELALQSISVHTQGMVNTVVTKLYDVGIGAFFAWGKDKGAHA